MRHEPEWGDDDVHCRCCGVRWNSQMDTNGSTCPSPTWHHPNQPKRNGHIMSTIEITQAQARSILLQAARNIRTEGADSLDLRDWGTTADGEPHQ